MKAKKKVKSKFLTHNCGFFLGLVSFGEKKPLWIGCARCRTAVQELETIYEAPIKPSKRKT